MTLTVEQRAEINRRNAQKSTGPKSPEGKERARRNALKHGLRAEALTLPGEDPAVVEARAHDWFAYYQPESPAAVHLTNECIRATLLADRVHQFQTAMLARQVREAEHHFDLDLAAEVERLVALLPDDPEAAVNQLKNSATGCRYLMTRWKELAERLQERGFWDNAERDEAIRLQGFSADPVAFRRNPGSCLTNLYSLMCHDRPSAEAIDRACHPNAMPISVRQVFKPSSLPTQHDARQALLGMIFDQVKWLQDTESQLYQAFEAPARAEASQRALVIHDPDQARLFLRYSSEARSSFHRAFKELTHTLERDRLHTDSTTDSNSSNNSGIDSSSDSTTDAPPTPAAADPETPAPEPSPNEANPGSQPAKSSQTLLSHPQKRHRAAESPFTTPVPPLTPLAQTA